ncbi:MAG: hypothetical protein R6U62_08465 [Bacteroidales bacterium]
MKKPILYLLFLLSTNFLSAQDSLVFSPNVPNVTNGLVDFTFDYNGTQVTYGTVLIDYGGSVGKRCLINRNLGAESRPFDPAGTQTNTNTDLYGVLFQWGRGDDGHQVADWTSSTTGDATPTTTTLSTSDNPRHDYFSINSTNPNDWRETQNNDL